MNDQVRKPVWAIVCGAIRRPVEFKFTITELMRLRSAGLIDAIVLSTWRGELEIHEGLKIDLLQLGVHIVENAIPDELGPWAILGQHKCFLNGLDLCPEDSFILKSRTDRAFELTWSFQDLLLSGLPNNSDESTSVLEYKIACTHFSTTMLLFAADFCFLAHRRDARKLVNFDRFYDKFQCGGEALPEIRWFSGPFIREFPFLDWLYRHVPWVELSIAVMAYADAGAEGPLPPAVRDAMALNLLIMDRYFLTTLKSELPENFDPKSLFSSTGSDCEGILTVPGNMWTLTRSSNTVKGFLSGYAEGVSKNIDEIAFTSRLGLRELGYRNYTAADLGGIFEFINKWGKNKKTIIEDCVITKSAVNEVRGEHTDVLKIFEDLNIDRDTFVEIFPELVSYAGGFGVPAAFLRKGMSLIDSGQDHLGLTFVENAAKMDDLASIAYLAERNFQSADPACQEVARKWAMRGYPLAKRFLSPELDRFKYIIDATDRD